MLNAFICVYSTAENIVSEHNKIENETDSYKNAQTNLSVLIEISFGIIAKFLTISSISIYYFIAILRLKTDQVLLNTLINILIVTITFYPANNY